MVVLNNICVLCRSNLINNKNKCLIVTFRVIILIHSNEPNFTRICFRLQVSAYLIQQAVMHGQKTDKDSSEHQEIIKSIFDHEDRDKDGAISHTEFSGPKHDEL